LRKGKGKLVILLIAVLLAAGFGYRVYRLATEKKAPSGPQEAQETIVKVTPVEKGTIRQDIRRTGDVEAMSSVQVFPKIPGRLVKLSVEKGGVEVPLEEGLAVEKDKTIAVIDHEDLDAQVNQATAAFSTAQARLKQADVLLAQTEKDLERTRNVFKEGGISRQALDKIEAEYESLVAQRDVAKAALDQSQAALNQANIQLKECFIRAPISGVISEKYLDEGDMAMVTRPIVTVVDVDKVKVTADLAERYIGQVRQGTPASLELDSFPGRVFEGIITNISPILNVINRTVKLEITVENPQHGLKPGMFARVTLNVAKKEGVAIVPEAAIVRDASGEYVFVVKDGVARRRDVVLGMEEGPRVEVSSGLEPGEILVLTGQHRVKDGQRVRIQN